MSEPKLKIQKIKGRPMLHWVGKKPIDVIENYPAQLMETVGGKRELTTPSFDALEQEWSNLLFHGDNKEILSTLLTNGFRGKVDLIYIDPPFDSAADYVRKVELRGTKERVTGEEQTTIEQVQYEDIWVNDNYLQFMYERLILLRELLSDHGSIYLHCDWHKSHQLRMLMDEVFGAENFINEVIWSYDFGGRPKDFWPRKHDNLLWYKKLQKPHFSLDGVERLEYKGNLHQYRGDVDSKEAGKTPTDVWEIALENKMSHKITGYPTQKPEELLQRIISTASAPGSIVLDCFIGSGTTAAVAQNLGRRWIGADINKGAIQSTVKRVQNIDDKQGNKPSMLHYRVNNYDFQTISNMRAIIIEKYGIEENKTDAFFDGVVGDRLVKIAELNTPVTKLEVQAIIDELSNRASENRDILLVGSGIELGVEAMLAERQQLAGAPNTIEIKDIQRDGIIVSEPAEADITITKSDNTVHIKLNYYLSPTIIARLNIDRSIFGERIKDFRAQIDTVLIDTNYDGQTFNVAYADVPEKKKDFVRGEYDLALPQSSQKIAVKITDMLGEETLIIQ